VDGRQTIGEVATELTIQPPDANGRSALRLTYTNGVACENGKISTTVDFMCGREFGSPRCGLPSCFSTL
jgi:hypothetical protein